MCIEIQVPLTELTTGDSFGELALLQKAPRQATVVTVTPTEVIVLDKTTYDNVIKVRVFSNIISLILRVCKPPRSTLFAISLSIYQAFTVLKKMF